MIKNFFRARLEQFKIWRTTPPTRLQRFVSALVGFLGFTIIGIVLGFALAPHHELSIAYILTIGGISGVFGIIFGATYPKLTRCLFFPLLIIGWGDIEVE